MRAVEQLRQVAIELDMVPVRRQVAVPRIWAAIDEDGELIDPPEVEGRALLDDLAWWARALRRARLAAADVPGSSGRKRSFGPFDSARGRRIARRRSRCGLAAQVVLSPGPTAASATPPPTPLARRGAPLVVMVCRDRARGEDAQSRLAAAATGAPPQLLLADLSAQSEIRSLATEMAVRHPCIDVLVNNAGGVFDHRELSVDGIEKTFATNHLAPFLLTHLLLGS